MNERECFMNNAEDIKKRNRDLIEQIKTENQYTIIHYTNGQGTQKNQKRYGIPGENQKRGEKNKK